MQQKQDRKPLFTRFGAYEADFRRRELRCAGSCLRLQEKPLAALALLIEKHGEIVTHDEFRRRLWQGNVIVEFDKNLATAVNKLRNALHDTAAEPKYIETIPRVGYRFIAPVEHVYEEPSANEPAAAAAAEQAPVRPAQATPSLSTGHRLRWVLAGGFVLVAAAMGVRLTLTLAPSNAGSTLPPTWKDSVVVGDFANSTGDAVFDGTLRQGLLSQLERSPHLNLVSDSRIAQTLALMARPQDAPLAPPIAHEICQRTGSAATIAGSIASLGRQYVLHLSAANCKTGDVLASEQVTAAEKEKVLGALGDAAARLRERLGDSLPALPVNEAPPENVTTTSLEALQAYSIGYRHLLVDNESVRASPFFERAIALDPKFAMAYARLARCYDAEDQFGKAAEYFAKAHALRHQASEREQFYIDSYYEFVSTGRLEAAAQNLELWAQTYPNDPAPLAALGNLYTTLGRFEKALDWRRRALQVDPSVGLNYGNLAQNLVQVERFQEARQIGRIAQDRHLDSLSLRSWLRWGEFLDGKPDDRAGIVGPFIDHPLAKEWVLLQDAAFAAWAGRLALARENTQASIDGYARSGRMEVMATREVESAIRDALAGESGVARRWAQSALAHSDSDHVRAGAAIVFALSGDAANALHLVEAIADRSPEATVVKGNYLPVVRAAVALRAGDPSSAVAALAPALPYGAGWLGHPLLPIYLRGQAYLALKDGAKAAAEFDLLRGGACTTHANFPCALAALQLARAHAIEGDVEASRAEYEHFIAQWKDADADAPLLRAAHDEYGKLAGRVAKSE
jgi:DNA-binding winged helix-turn-helix (wHTH) protein/tetratricopeptide (TPR) repeat protein